MEFNLHLLFKIANEPAMIGVAEAIPIECLHDVQHRYNERQRCAELVTGIQYVVEVFDVEVNSESGR